VQVIDVITQPRNYSHYQYRGFDLGLRMALPTPVKFPERRA
jgi:hypothetical protein